MAKVRFLNAAAFRIDEIYRYCRDTWGDRQAKAYIGGLLNAFNKIESLTSG